MIALLQSNPAFPQMTGPMRSSFIDSYSQACLRSQRSAKVNSAVPEKTIIQYCKCSAIYMADNLNNALAQSIVAGEQRINPSLNEVVAGYCQKNFEKY